jgi:hypothetical protein
MKDQLKTIRKRICLFTVHALVLGLLNVGVLNVGPLPSASADTPIAPNPRVMPITLASG